MQAGLGTFIALAGLAAFLSSCSESGRSDRGSDPVATGSNGGAAVHDAGDRRGGRMASFFETIPERAQQGCQGFVAEDPAISDLCEQALGAAYREVGRRAEAAPASSEGAIQGLARTCLREAYEHSKVEGTGKTPGALFVEGLAKVVPCLDRQMAELEKRGEAGSSAEPPRG